MNDRTRAILLAAMHNLDLDLAGGDEAAKEALTSHAPGWTNAELDVVAAWLEK
jgi:hypothetical protein